MNAKKEIRLWCALLVLLHAWISFFLFRHLLVICGDSDFYLAMAQPGGVLSAADRPLGFSAVLRALSAATGWTGVPSAAVLVLFIHAVATLSIALAAASVVRETTSRAQRIGTLATLAAGFFFPLTLLFHSTALMPDSLAFSVTLLGLAAALSARDARLLALAALALGAACTVRSGQLLYSLPLTLVLARKIHRQKGAPLAALTLLAALAVPASYQLSAGASGSYIAGRNVVAHVLPYLDCASLGRLARDEGERAAIAKNCLPGDFTLPEWKIVWSPLSLLSRIDNTLGSDRLAANARYDAWAARAILLAPGAIFRSGLANLRTAWSDPVSQNFRLLQAAALGPNCSGFPQILWHQPAEKYVWSWQDFQRDNAGALAAFDNVAAALSPLWNMLAFLLLAWPLVPRAGWPVYRGSSQARLAHLVALLACAVFLFGCYYYSRHMLFFAQLSFFQFALFLRERKVTSR